MDTAPCLEPRALVPDAPRVNHSRATRSRHGCHVCRLQSSMRFLPYIALAGCALGSGDATSSTDSDVKIGDALRLDAFTKPLDRASIRALQFWIDDATFDIKWTTMTSAPIEFLGGASSMYYRDLKSLPSKRL